MQKKITLFATIIAFCVGCSAPSSSSEKGGSMQTDKTNIQNSNPNKNVYFGDLHVHTSWSFDAFIYNVRTNPDDAYNFAKGKAIDHVSGNKIQLGRPLDFMAVTDHSEYMGIMMQMLDESSPIAKLQIAERIKSPDRQVSKDAFGEVGLSISRNQPKMDLLDKPIMEGVWGEMIGAAERHNEPGKFTTFVGYEWTSSPSDQSTATPFARNMHRNVIYRNTNVSSIPFSSFNSQDPEDLWQWMDNERKKGIDLFAIPHNQNMSDGLMYDLKGMHSGDPLDKSYADSRQRNEPIHEVSQIKGTSMTHPDLSPNDEFANFELYPFTFVSSGNPPPSRPNGSYVRQALKRGVAMQDELGSNPFKFGFIGSSDGHNSAGPVEEDNYFGKLGNIDMLPELRIGGERDVLNRAQMSAGSLAAVWATENSRDAIFDGMLNRETYATSGPRMQVRFFGGWDLDPKLMEVDEWTAQAYKNGVPMGSDLAKRSSDGVPSFAIWAVKDPEGANLDRVQVIKLWKDGDGNPQEKVFEAVWSGERELTRGKLPSIGNSTSNGEPGYTNDIGSVALSTIWVDPEFDASHDAAYYLRVLEIPTPRWSAYDAYKLGQPHPKNISSSIQERAWSSPIWYNSGE